MASHGVPRVTDAEPRSDAAVKRELERIGQYQSDVEELRHRGQIKGRDFSEETLSLCTRILTLNPEFYTAWNQRRKILLGQWGSPTDAQDLISRLITSELRFLASLMLKHPKCYWIWNYRLWILDQATSGLEASAARDLWLAELALVSKMLARDERNFHGWRYRRMVVAELESARRSPSGVGTSQADEEFNYTTHMIQNNLSNFSAWHNRSKLILRMLEERQANATERQAFLDQELNLIHEALIDPYDQSLWFYHACIVAAFDPLQASRSMAPALTTKERLQYLGGEIEYVSEMLEDTTDCKWVYQTLLSLAQLYQHQAGQWPPGAEAAQVRAWLNQLEAIDPLRRGRWADLRAKTIREPASAKAPCRS